jgi:tetratricopeptide (TPR) repeat protein
MRHTIPFALALSLLFATASFAEESAKEHYDAARKAEAARDYVTAMAEYDKVLDLDEEYEDAFDRWDACHKLAEWQEGLEGKPTAMDLVRLGEVNLELERYAEEKACYEEALRMDAKCAAAHGHLALWHYTRGEEGEGFPAVYRETLLLLESSPNRERLKQAIADFEVYGGIRNRAALLRDRLAEAAAASKAKDWKKASDLLEAAASDESLPMGARIWILDRAGETRAKHGDIEGARRDFTTLVGLPASSYTIDAHLALAVFDTREGKLDSALDHLKAAVAEGSGACAKIEKYRDKAFAKLVEAYPAEMDRLVDEEAADEPIRARIRAAEERAAKEGKKVLVHWYGPYCPYVMSLQERLESPEIQKLIADKFVYVRVDQGAPHRALALDEEYGVMEEQGVPCFFVFNADGTLDSVQRDLGLMGAEHRSYSTEKILEWLRGAAPKGE